MFSWRGMKDNFLVWKESFFLVKEVMYLLSKREQEESLIDRQNYKEFDDFGPRDLNLNGGEGKQSVKLRERKKKDFCLRGNARRETTRFEFCQLCFL